MKSKSILCAKIRRFLFTSTMQVSWSCYYVHTWVRQLPNTVCQLITIGIVSYYCYSLIWLPLVLLLHSVNWAAAVQIVTIKIEIIKTMKKTYFVVVLRLPQLTVKGLTFARKRTMEYVSYILILNKLTITYYIIRCNTNTCFNTYPMVF